MRGCIRVRLVFVCVSAYPGGKECHICDRKVSGSSLTRCTAYRTDLRKPITHICLCHQAAQFGTGGRAAVLRSWEGNRRSGVALRAMRPLRYRLKGLQEGDEHQDHSPI